MEYEDSVLGAYLAEYGLTAEVRKLPNYSCKFDMWATAVSALDGLTIYEDPLGKRELLHLDYGQTVMINEKTTIEVLPKPTNWSENYAQILEISVYDKTGYVIAYTSKPKFFLYDWKGYLNDFSWIKDGPFTYHFHEDAYYEMCYDPGLEVYRVEKGKPTLAYVTAESGVLRVRGWSNEKEWCVFWNNGDIAYARAEQLHIPNTDQNSNELKQEIIELDGYVAVDYVPERAKATANNYNTGPKLSCNIDVKTTNKEKLKNVKITAKGSAYKIDKYGKIEKICESASISLNTSSSQENPENIYYSGVFDGTSYDKSYSNNVIMVMEIYATYKNKTYCIDSYILLSEEGYDYIGNNASGLGKGTPKKVKQITVSEANTLLKGKYKINIKDERADFNKKAGFGLNE